MDWEWFRRDKSAPRTQAVLGRINLPAISTAHWIPCHSRAGGNCAGMTRIKLPLKQGGFQALRSGLDFLPPLMQQVFGVAVGLFDAFEDQVAGGLEGGGLAEITSHSAVGWIARVLLID